MLTNKAWLTVSIPIHPKGVGWGPDQGSVQASQVLPYQTGPLWTTPLRNWRVAGPSHAWFSQCGGLPPGRGALEKGTKPLTETHGSV